MWQVEQQIRRDEPVRVAYPRTRVTGRDVTRIVWRSLAVVVVAEALLAYLGVSMSLATLVLLAAGAFAAARIVTAAKPPPVEPPLPPAGADPRPADRPFRDVTRMEDRLAWGGLDMGRFEVAVRPALIRLIDERICQRHGITRDSHPQRARQLLGDDLWQLVTGPSRASKAPGPTPALLMEQVRRIERL